VTTPISGPPPPPEPPPAPALAAVPAADPHDRKGLPAPGAIGAGSAPDRPTRKPMSLWDRTKFLLLFFLLFWFFVWSEYSNPNPFNSLGDAVRDTFRTKWPLFLLAGLEVVRQTHFLISEHSPAYHRFWTEAVFGRIERRTGRMNDWNRYRLARAAKVVVLLAVLSIILGTIFDVAPPTALVELPSRVWSFLPILLQAAVLMLMVVGQFVALFWFLSRGGVDTYMPEEIKTRFTDVWGQDHVLDRVRENMVFLERPDAIEAKGGYVPSGILLHGPPGTGKTLMAEAVAGETGHPYVFVDPGAFINMFMGVGILKVKSLFRKLRKLALRYGGVIVFFDEADALGSRGSLMPGGEFGANPAASQWNNDHLRWLSPATQSMLLTSSLAPSTTDDRPPVGAHRIIMGGMGGGGGGTLQALLSELSGLKKPRGIINRYGRRLLGMQPKPPPKYRILVMMATNMPESLDPAMLRPGRIDRIYKVGYPSKDGRIRTYQGYLDKVANELTPEQVEKLAVITPYATGAEMKDLVNEALIVAIREGHDIITWGDVMKAKHLKDLGPPEDVEYIERERHAIAIHEACHAVAAYRTNYNMDIDLATIEKGGNYLGMVRTIKPEDQFSHWRSELEGSIVVSLASLAGERMFFEGNNTSGVSGDLESATTIAMQMEAYFGMGQTVTSHGVTRKAGVGGAGGRRPGGNEENSESEIIKSALGERIEENLARLLTQAEELLVANRAEVLRLAHALEVHKTISGEDVMAIIDGRPGPLVNGEAYVDEAFMHAMEQFHTAVVAAHKSHNQVALPLPSVASAVPVEPPSEAAPEALQAAAAVLVADPPPPPPPPPAPAPEASTGNGGTGGHGSPGSYYGSGGYRGNGGPTGGHAGNGGKGETTAEPDGNGGKGETTAEPDEKGDDG
jgi:cell division protease FtsH